MVSEQPQHIGRSIAEQPFGGGVEQGDPLLLVGHDDAVMGQIDDPFQPLLRQPEVRSSKVRRVMA